MRLKQGNDETIKKHLAGKLKESRESCEQLRRSLDTLDEVYGKTTQTNEQIMIEFNQLREENKRIVDQLRLEEQKKLNELKERMLLE